MNVEPSFLLSSVVESLDKDFNVRDYIGRDTAFVNRIPAFFDSDVLSRLEPGFAANCNGMMIRGSDFVERVFGSAFLSNDVLIELANSNPKNSILIVHHPLNVESGINESTPAGYRAASSELLLSYIAEGGSVYCLHMPLDINTYEVNTHVSLMAALSLKQGKKSPLLRVGEYEFGYVLDVALVTNRELLNNIKSISPRYLQYGVFDAHERPIKRIGVLAGMISSVEQLEQIEQKKCDLCICGDLLMRDGSERYVAIKRAVSECSTPFICLSHNISEYQVFEYGLFPYIHSRFPRLACDGLLANHFK